MTLLWETTQGSRATREGQPRSLLSRRLVAQMCRIPAYRQIGTEMVYTWRSARWFLSSTWRPVDGWSSFVVPSHAGQLKKENKNNNTTLSTKRLPCNIYIACVRGSPMVPLVGNICTIGTNLITNGTIGKENGKNGNAIGTNGTNVTIGRTPNTRIVIMVCT